MKGAKSTRKVRTCGCCKKTWAACPCMFLGTLGEVRACLEHGDPEGGTEQGVIAWF